MKTKGQLFGCHKMVFIVVVLCTSWIAVPGCRAMQHTACVDTEFEINCQPGHMIVINSAVYGTDSYDAYGTMANNPCQAPTAENCTSSQAVLVANEKCSGHQHCSFNVTAADFVGLCPGGRNALSVQYECIDKALVHDVCNVSNITGPPSIGYISSPNYPEPYDDNLDCEVRVSDTDSDTVQASLLDLDVEARNNTPGCYDYLRLVERDRVYFSYTHCGDVMSTVEPRQVHFQDLIVTFWTDASNPPMRGFLLRYEVITPTTTMLETTVSTSSTASHITSPSTTTLKPVGTVSDASLPIATKEPEDATTSTKTTAHETESTSPAETPSTTVDESANGEETAVDSTTTVSGIAEETAADVSDEPIDGIMTTSSETEDVSLENTHTLSTIQDASDQTVDDSMTTASDIGEATADMMTDASVEEPTSSSDAYTDESAIGITESESAMSTSAIDDSRTDDSMTTVSEIDKENATSVSSRRTSSFAITASIAASLSTTVSHSPTKTARTTDVTSSVSVGSSPANGHGGTNMTPGTSGESTTSRATTTERVTKTTRLITLSTHGVVSTATTDAAGDTTRRLTVTEKTPHTSSSSDGTTTGSQTSTGLSVTSGSTATPKQTVTSKSPPSTERMTEGIADHSYSTIVIPKINTTESEAIVPTTSGPESPVTVNASSSDSASVTPTTTTTTTTLTTKTTLHPPPKTTTTMLTPTTTNGTVVVGASTSDSDGPSDAVVAVIVVIICLLVLVLVALLAIYYVRKQRRTRASRETERLEPRKESRAGSGAVMYAMQNPAYDCEMAAGRNIPEQNGDNGVNHHVAVDISDRNVAANSKSLEDDKLPEAIIADDQPIEQVQNGADKSNNDPPPCGDPESATSAASFAAEWETPASVTAGDAGTVQQSEPIHYEGVAPDFTSESNNSEAVNGDTSEQKLWGDASHQTHSMA